MHLAAKMLRQGHRVTWLECSQVLPASRLAEFLEHPESTTRGGEHGGEDERQEEVDLAETERLLRRVTCVHAPTLTSLLSLLLPSPEGKEDERNAGEREGDGLVMVEEGETGLLVLDDLTTLANAAFPPDNQRDTNAKKARILTLLADALSKLAVTQNIAVLVLCKLTSKITRGGPAQLESPFGDAWAAACAVRLVLYRDFYAKRLSQLDDDEVRWVAIQKAGNRNVLEPVGLPIKIIGMGIVSLDLAASQLSRSQSSTPRPRLLDGGNIEVQERPATPVAPEARRGDGWVEKEGDARRRSTTPNLETEEGHEKKRIKMTADKRNSAEVLAHEGSVSGIIDDSEDD